MDSDLIERAIRETRDLHDFFVAWLRPDSTVANLARLEAVLAPDFRMVAPDGVARDRAAVLALLESAHGTASAGFGIEILEPAAVWQAGNAVLLDYVERQYRPGEETRRRSTGLFTRAAWAPHGVVWRHLHETWEGPAESR